MFQALNILINKSENYVPSTFKTFQKLHNSQELQWTMILWRGKWHGDNQVDQKHCCVAFNDQKLRGSLQG